MDRRVGLLACATLLSSLSCASAPEPAPAVVTLEDLKEGEIYDGFRAEAVYLGAQGVPMGARMAHVATGFTLDYLSIQSVPQGFTWVTTYPDSDRGEPHTQEHLLLGKGNKGRSVANLEDMSLVSSTAYTQQWRTCYHFNTSAGPEVFFDVLRAQLDALLHPDYTDLEVEREVHHFGVKGDARSGALALEEKGTVYQEMSSTFDRPMNRVWRSVLETLYGEGHPLALSSGGMPDAIRTMTPEHIRTFHAAHYQLHNMGMIASLPREIPLADALTQMDTLLDSLTPPGEAPPPAKVMTEADLPAPAPAPPGPPQLVDFPSADTEVPADMLLVWPPGRTLTPTQGMLLDLFLANLAGDANSDLYGRIVDAERRTLDLGATEVYAFRLDQQGQPIVLGVGGIPAAHRTAADGEALAALVAETLREIRDLPPGDPALTAFNRRLRSRLVSSRRAYAKFVNSPPGFGFRGGGGAWVGHLQTLSEAGGFERSVTLEPEMAAVEALLGEEGNPWTALIDGWGLLDTPPRILIGRPSPALRDAQTAEREERLAEGLVALQARYAVSDPQAALARFQEDYGAETAALDAVAANVKTPAFLSAPPLSLDERLTYEVAALPGGEIPFVKALFPTMSGGTIGLALDLHAVPRSQWDLLTLLPELMSKVGVQTADGPMAWPDMLEALQNEILSLGVWVDGNPRLGRLELVVGASWAFPEEAEAALSWMERALYHPDWRPENLPRIRDLIDERLTALAQVTRQAEERWVQDPAQAYLYQGSGPYLVTQSVFTRRHNLYRLKWRFTDPGVDGVGAVFRLLAEGPSPIDRGAMTAALQGLMTGAPPAELAEALGALSPEGRARVAEGAGDLLAILGGLPDASLAQDVVYLCRQLTADVAEDPVETLKALDGLRLSLLSAGGARSYGVASAATFEAIEPGLRALTAGLGPEGPGGPAVISEDPGFISQRLADRGAPAAPRFPGLINPESPMGVVVHSAPSATLAEADPDALLTYLSTLLYAGGGGHSLFMQTWGAGLAYSNGIRSSVESGRLNYYAERSPDLSATLSFVVGILSSAQIDAGLTEYAIAQAFKGSRAAQSFESRGAAMAADLADGEGPEVVAAFRERILALRDVPELASVLAARMPAAYGPVLPGYGAPAGGQGAVLMVIGPEAQMETYEAWLREVESPEAALTPIHPRDFWIPGPEGMGPEAP